MTEQSVLTDNEREFVALGAAIGAGCQPCTQYHVKAALNSGLSEQELRLTIDAAEAVRHEGGIAVSNVGRRILGVEEEPSRATGAPSDRHGALTYIGAAAGSNAGSLLVQALEATQEADLSADEVRAALEIVQAVKQRAADFLLRDAERVLREALPTESASPQGCCGPEPAVAAAGRLRGKEVEASCG